MGIFGRNDDNAATGTNGEAPQEGAALEATRESIDDFWAWWAARGKAEASELFAGRGDEARFAAFGEELGEKVTALGDVAVATGPGRTAKHCLVVTAGGNPELRDVAAAWLAAAPETDEEFEYADHRQPHPDPQSLSLRFDGGELDLASTTLLTQTEGRTVHVQISHPTFAELGENDRLQVAFLFLDAVLGERDVENRIGEVDIVANHALGTSPVSLLELPGIVAAAN